MDKYTSFIGFLLYERTVNSFLTLDSSRGILIDDVNVPSMSWVSGNDVSIRNRKYLGSRTLPPNLARKSLTGLDPY